MINNQELDNENNEIDELKKEIVVLEKKINSKRLYIETIDNDINKFNESIKSSRNTHIFLAIICSLLLAADVTSYIYKEEIYNDLENKRIKNIQLMKRHNISDNDLSKYTLKK